MAKTSAFSNKLKKYKSSITGEEREYIVNNAVWLHLLEDYGMTSERFDEEVATNGPIALAKFVTCVLKANGVDTDLEDVMANTTDYEITEFYNDFFRLAYNLSEPIEEVVQKAAEKRAKSKAKD